MKELVIVVEGLKDESCNRRLTILWLQTLEDRKLRGDLILVVSIMTGRLDLLLEECFTRPSLGNLRGHRLKLCHRRFYMNRRGAAFSLWIVTNWNKLPPILISAPSIMTFNIA